MHAMRSFTDVNTLQPDGTFYARPDFRAYNGNAYELALFLLRKALVVTVPGVAFGMEGHLRLSFSGTTKELNTGVDWMKHALDHDAPNEIYLGDRKLIRDWM